MIIFLPLLVCVTGLVVYALATNAKVVELARLAYFAGLLAFLLIAGPHIVSLLGGR